MLNCNDKSLLIGIFPKSIICFSLFKLWNKNLSILNGFMSPWGSSLLHPSKSLAMPSPASTYVGCGSSWLFQSFCICVVFLTPYCQPFILTAIFSLFSLHSILLISFFWSICSWFLNLVITILAIFIALLPNATLCWCVM